MSRTTLVSSVPTLVQQFLLETQPFVLTFVKSVEKHLDEEKKSSAKILFQLWASQTKLEEKKQVQKPIDPSKPSCKHERKNGILCGRMICRNSETQEYCSRHYKSHESVDEKRTCVHILRTSKKPCGKSASRNRYYCAKHQKMYDEEEEQHEDEPKEKSEEKKSKEKSEEKKLKEKVSEDKAKNEIKEEKKQDKEEEKGNNEKKKILKKKKNEDTIVKKDEESKKVSVRKNKDGKYCLTHNNIEYEVDKEKGAIVARMDGKDISAEEMKDLESVFSDKK